MNQRSTAFWLAAVVGVFALLELGSYDYLLVHSLGEVFSSAVGIAIFMVAWNARRFLKEQPLLLTLGVALLFVGFVDILHALAYRGMGVFSPFAGGHTTNLATQLWIVARMLFAGALLVGLLLPRRTVRPMLTLAVVAFITGGLLALVFTGIFPTCYLTGVGLTPFKIVAELVVVAFLLGAGLLLWWRRDSFEPRVVRCVAWAVALTVVSELCFILYRDPFALTNAVGHVLKIAAYVMLYRAFVQLGLREPYALLFRELKQSETALAEANRTLEERVTERTAELLRRQEELRSLALELTQVERRERRRLATLLHDELAQLLVTVKVRLAVVFQDAAAGSEDERRIVNELLDEAMIITRDLIAELTPPRLHRGGLVQALRALADRVSSHHGLRVEVVADDELPGIESDIRETAFNAARELVMNAARHSGAPSARVEVSCGGEGSLHIVVEDRGAGFEPEVAAVPRADGGFGLFNLRQQIELVGGKVLLTSRPSAGTRAELIIPLSGSTPNPDAVSPVPPPEA